jgi:precorrin-6B methylase 2
MLARILHKIKDFDSMTTDDTRIYVGAQLSNYSNLLEIGCGSGALSLDFILNGGQVAKLLDIRKNACEISLLNIQDNIQFNPKMFDDSKKISIFNGSVESYALDHIQNTQKYDCIVIGTAWVNTWEIHLLLKHCLADNGLILGILREDVINPISMASVKELFRQCKIKKIDTIIDPADNRMRLIYQAQF